MIGRMHTHTHSGEHVGESCALSLSLTILSAGWICSIAGLRFSGGGVWFWSYISFINSRSVSCTRLFLAFSIELYCWFFVLSAASSSSRCRFCSSTSARRRMSVSTLSVALVFCCSVVMVGVARLVACTVTSLLFWPSYKPMALFLCEVIPNRWHPWCAPFRTRLISLAILFFAL